MGPCECVSIITASALFPRLTHILCTDDLIDSLGDAKFITTLDLSRGYWQVPMSEEAKPRTAFTTPFGLFQFCMMPFGLQGAITTFQRMMDIILDDTGDYAAAYLDDVIIHSKSWSELASTPCHRDFAQTGSCWAHPKS